MLENNLKALAVVLTIAVAVFGVAKPVCLRFMSTDSFARRRNVWFVLTVIAFVSPTYWAFVGVAAVVALWLARRETNPLAAFLFLAFVIPPFRYGLNDGVYGIADLNIYRLLALALLVPWAVRHWRQSLPDPSGKRRMIDALILSFGAIHVATMMPYEPATRTVLHTLLFTLDTFIVYYVASRSCDSKAKIIEVLACLCLAGALLAPMGLFAALRTWPLYGGVSVQWGGGGALLFRDGTLRASVTTGHALGLGYFCGIGFGVWLYLSRQVGSWRSALLGIVWLWAGLIAALSRAPWLMAVLVYLAFAFFGSVGLSKFFRALLALGAIAAVVLMSPYGDRVIDLLPFVGTVDAHNVEYRQRLLDATWMLVAESPWFGNRFVTRDMEHMLNGQGIVDMVNAYASTALFYGWVGLGVFCGPQVGALLLAWTATWRLSGPDGDDDTALGGVLIACMLGTVFYQLASGPMWMQYVFIGLMLAYRSVVVRDQGGRTTRTWRESAATSIRPAHGA